MRKKMILLLSKHDSYKVMIFNDIESQLIFCKNQTSLFFYVDCEKFP